MLRLEGVRAGYGPIDALRGLDLEVRQGELVCLLGANGAGKSSTLRTISGLLRPRAGRIVFDGTDIHGREPSDVLRAGIAHCPEGRHVFPYLTVRENLTMGAYVRRDAAAVAADLERVYAHFPILADRRRQAAGTLSGGEQQMLAIGRALMARPRLIMFDEPSLGLAPTIVETTFAIIGDIRRSGTTVLMVEQNARLALRMADRGYVMEAGRIVLSGAARELLHNDHVRAAYLGG
jgi:branched-chain amino acid transport system ATP-binding protein